MLIINGARGDDGDLHDDLLRGGYDGDGVPHDDVLHGGGGDDSCDGVYWDRTLYYQILGWEHTHYYSPHCYNPGPVGLR